MNLKSDDIFNGDYTISNQAYMRMDGLVGQKDYTNFINAATKIMNDLSAEGFDAKDIFYYLYTRLTADV